MSNVIGPISFEDWRTMALLRESLAWMKLDSNRFKNAIERETTMYQGYFKKYNIAS